MKALFIGGTGTISTDVVALAQQRGWEITLLNRGSKKMPEGIHSIIADINDEEAVAKAIALEHYDVVAQFIGYLIIGICTFLIIGLFHPVVIKAEYYWGTKCWWIFLILGIVGVILALWVKNIMWSSLLGVFAFSSFWTIKEVFEQEERVKKGWFPKNPKRNYNF